MLSTINMRMHVSFVKVIIFAFAASCASVSGNQWQPKSLSKWGIKSPTDKLVSPLNQEPRSNESGEEIAYLINTFIRGGGDQEKGKATIAASVFNLVNNVAGAGILTLSAGMASGTGWFPSIAICAFLGSISAHCFSMIGAACELTGEEDFKVLVLR